MEDYTVDVPTTLRRGQAARVVLEDKTVQEAMSVILDQLQHDIMNTFPEETEDREAKYFEHRGLRLLMAELQNWVEDMKQLETEESNT